ncbi:hypothetical protein chiPu_0025777, partial [Chiloscyllium punctatum]|nr:hypothetical protein [Chiloscyllium punctatum]
PEGQQKSSETKSGACADWITLNVGGQYFTTTRSTLVNKEPESMLAHMFSDKDAWGNKRDHQGGFLIDRSPEYFMPILNYLRHGQLIVNKGLNLLAGKRGTGHALVTTAFPGGLSVSKWR